MYVIIAMHTSLDSIDLIVFRLRDYFVVTLIDLNNSIRTYTYTVDTNIIDVHVLKT